MKIKCGDLILDYGFNEEGDYDYTKYALGTVVRIIEDHAYGKHYNISWTDAEDVDELHESTVKKHRAMYNTYMRDNKI